MKNGLGTPYIIIKEYNKIRHTNKEIMKKFEENQRKNEEMYKRMENALLDFDKLARYTNFLYECVIKLCEQSEQKSKNVIKVPCQVGDPCWVIAEQDEDENSDKIKIYPGKWTRISLVSHKNGTFEVHGEIEYEVYDFFHKDGRLMKQHLYVGQNSTKLNEVVFLNEAAATQFYDKIIANENSEEKNEDEK